MAAVDRIGGLASATSLAIKAPCLVATTGANITLSGVQVIDGVTVGNASERVLVKDQTDARQNGIYIASSGNWLYASDSDGNTDWTAGTMVTVSGGLANAGKAFQQTCADNPVVVGTSLLGFGILLPSIVGTNTWLATQTFAPSGSAAQAIIARQTLSGVIAQNFTCPSYFAFDANSLSITETVAMSSNLYFLDGWAFHHNVNAGFLGGRQGLVVNLNMNGAPSGANVNDNYCALASYATAAANLGGIVSVPAGAIFGLGAVGLALNGATYLLNVTGAEFNVAVNTGASTAFKSLIQLSARTDDAVQGTTVDTMIWMYSQQNNILFRNALFIDGSAGFFPIASNGYVMRVLGNTGGSTIANGIDLSDTHLTITGSAFKSNNFAVSGAGALTAFTVAAPNMAASNGVATPVILNGGSGLTLGNSTDALKLGGSAMWAANGTGAFSFTSLAPAGAHSTVQEWLTILDAAGTLRYIPAF